MNRNQYFAAYAQADITPDFVVELVGFYRGDGHSRGVLSRLYAQLILLTNGQESFCLIEVDNIGLSAADAAAIRAKVADCLGTATDHVMLCNSHTHSGPLTASHGLNAQPYMRALEAAVLGCAERAKGNCRPCKAGWAVTHAGIGANRRSGGTRNDDRVGLLRIADAETDAPIAVVARVTAHANVLVEDNHLVSSDYFGAARDALAGLCGCPVMLTQGAAGNVKPAFQGTVADLARTAEALKVAVAPVAFDMQDIRDLRMASTMWQFTAEVPDEAQAAKIATDAMRECGIDGQGWLAECDRLRRAGVREQTRQVEFQYLKINEGCLCGIPNEAFCEIALDIRDQAREPLLFFSGYTNGIDSYLPGREEWRKGGYEVLYSHLIFYPYFGVMPYREETADFIVASVGEIWRDLNL